MIIIHILVWLGLGLFFTVGINLFAFLGGAYSEYSEWEFKGITPRLLFVDLILTMAMPVAALLFVIGLLWVTIGIFLMSDWAGKPICKCTKRKP